MRSCILLPAFRIATAVCVLFATVVTTAPNALDTRTSCQSGVFTIVARGSEEPQGQSKLETIVSGITAAIPGSSSNEVVYPALLSFWNSAPTGVTNLQQQMEDYYADCPDGKMVLMGYSQGSFVVSTALAGGNFSGQTWKPISSDIGKNGKQIFQFNDEAARLTAASCSRSCRRVWKPGTCAWSRDCCGGHQLRNLVHCCRCELKFLEHGITP